MGSVAVVVLLAVFALLQSSSGLLHKEAPPPTATAPAPAAPLPPRAERSPAPEDLLQARNLVIPVEGIPRSQLRDTFHAGRGKGRKHRAIDIMARWGTPVLAADDGVIAKIGSNRAGGLAVYQVDGSGSLVYYYAHLAGYADALREGQRVRRGEVIGYVGATGNAPDDAPHLHFAVLVLSGERRWWGGEAINPYPALSRGDTVTASGS